MDLEQGTAEALQDEIETPPNDEKEVSQETELTDEQKEELAAAEEAKKHIKDDDPESVQKRINQVVRKMRQEERKRVQAETEKTDIAKAFDELSKHNKKLYDAMMRQANATESLIESQNERDSKKTTEQEVTALNQRVAYLKQERIKARQEMDYNREAIIDDQIDQLKEQLIVKRTEAPKEKQKADPDEKYQQTVINEWVVETPWFSPIIDDEPNTEYNPTMERAAREYDKHLLSMEKWQGVSIEKRLAEVRKKIEEKFDYQPKKRGMTATPSPESGKNLPPSKKANEVQLTDEQKTTAHKLLSYLPAAEAEKAYAEQLKVINGGR